MAAQVPRPPTNNVVLGPGGKLDPQWQVHHDTTYQYLQDNVGPNGFRLPPMTTAERDGLKNVGPGITIFNTETDQAEIYKSSGWTAL